MRRDPAGNPLPPRLHWKHGAYYRVAQQQWTLLAYDYAEALRAWSKAEGALDAARTVGQAMEAYIVERGPELADKTLKEYRYSRDRLAPVFGHCMLDDVARQDVREYLHRRKAATAANRDVAFLRAAYSHAFERGWCEDNPCKGIRRRTEKPRRRTANEGEVSVLAGALPPRWRALLRVALLSGMRPGEMRMLRKDALSLFGIDLVRPKTDAHSLIEWTPALVDAVRDAFALSGDSDLVFPARHGRAYAVDAFSRQWARYCARAGIEGLTMYDTRRTAASNAATLQEARDLLGHGDTRITKRVYKVRTKVRPVG